MSDFQNKWADSGKKLKEMIDQSKYSRNDLAKMLNVSISAVFNWQMGRRLPSRIHLIKMKNIFEKKGIMLDLEDFVQDGMCDYETKASKERRRLETIQP